MSDVYSLGVLAYVVLTGRGPYAVRSDRLGELMHAVLTAEPQRASLVPGLAPQYARKLRGDLETVLAKAVAKEPPRRYASVEQLADDFESYCKGDRVRARADTLAYRLLRTVGRHRAAFVVAGVLGVGLIAATIVSTWQARLAQRRFEDLRAFAHAVVFDVNDALAPIPGTTAARKLVVETALQYLDRLNRGGLSATPLREELAAAYIRIGKVQGGAFLPNLGDSTGAIASFRKAVAAVGAATTRELQHRAIEAHINLGRLMVDPVQGAAEFDAAIGATPARSPESISDLDLLRLMADAWHGHATVDHLTDRVHDEASMSRREIAFRRRILELTPGAWRAELDLAGALAQHALALEQSADFAGSLAELRRAQTVLEASLERNPGNQILIRALADKRSRAGSVLTPQGRAAEGADEIRAAIDALEPLAAADPDDVQYRRDLAYAWFRLGDALRAQGELAPALDFHRRALAVRREQATRDPAFTFNRWELARSLNTVGALLLDVAPHEAAAAVTLFDEARTLAVDSLTLAPSFNELRKEVAYADEGLARAALAAHRGEEARALLERALATWSHVLAFGSGDDEDADAPDRVRQLLLAISS
jgi:tetratricopeptide (TPR) repeat protein